MLPVVLLAPVAWALGTFPSAALVARARGHDVTSEGSGNPGASNVVRIMGWKAGVVVLVMDFAKAAGAAGAGLVLWGRGGAYVLGFAAVLGHTFPLWRKGGKGVAAAGGTLVVLFPLIVAAVGVVWFVVARLLHKASLGSLLVCAAFPAAVALLGYEWPEIAVVGALAVLIIARHAANIRRLLRHEEIDLRGPT